ncbi:hypothetical protein CY34DRAFT_82578 [Suillus luteus UH-Slu-Lm8-n1]|uniref:NADH dehydrogenase [ubiquinone] 1 alpha subcomplex subunit 4 n=1 Tax=Suillus luteus UH-Slu-Lm8-n1 TaxID=930992 RepID=A0A0D0AZ46_9AGAM|nr:hypothetical protein CY34DRAFT_82578 [Suillus luteus UH-Slu-Lm8-n1]
MVAPRGARTFMRNWFAIEVLFIQFVPAYAVIGLAVGGAGWYLTRLARGPTVVWTKSNPTPWNDIKQDENIKILDPNSRFAKSWSRDKL